MSKAKLLSDLLRAAVAERPLTVGLSIEYAKEILELIDRLARIESAGGVEEIRERHSRWLEHFGAECAQEIETRRDIATLIDVVARQTVDCQEASGRIEELERRNRYISQERDAARAEVERQAADLEALRSVVEKEAAHRAEVSRLLSDFADSIEHEAGVYVRAVEENPALALNENWVAQQKYKSRIVLSLARRLRCILKSHEESGR